MLIQRVLHVLGIVGVALFCPLTLDAQVAVRHTEGLLQGFLELSTLDGRFWLTVSKRKLHEEIK